MVLALGAVFVAVEGPGPTINGWVAARGASAVVAVVLGVAALALLALALNIWHERNTLRQELDGVRPIIKSMPPGLRIGSLAPDFATLDADGATITLDELRSRGLPVALIFGVPGCGPCSSLAPDFVRWQKALVGNVTVALIGIDLYLRYEQAALLTEEGTVNAVYESSPDLARELDELNTLLASYQLHATPTAVIVTAEGTIASATVHGRPAIEELLHLTAARRGAPGVAVGSATDHSMRNIAV